MEDSVVEELEAINEIEDDCEPFASPEDTASHNDFIPDGYESSDFAVIPMMKKKTLFAKIKL